MQKTVLKILTLMTLLTMAACGDKPPALEKSSAGEQIFLKNCKVCHAQGLNGAPILGNKAMWSKRIGQGLPVLVEHASQGYGLMPAKGGNTSLADADVELAVRYMLSKVE